MVRTRLRRSVALAAAMATMMVATACGDDAGDASNTSSTARSSPTASSPAASSPAANSAASSTPTSEGPVGEAPASVTIGAGGVQAFLLYAVHLVALGQDLFAPVEARFGTKIKSIDAGVGGDSIALISGGAADALLIDIGPQSAAIRGNVDMTGVIQICGNGAIVLVGAKSHEADWGTDMAKYANATWGYTSPGGSSEFTSIRAAEEAGLDWTKLKTVSFGATSAGAEGLKAKRLDVVAVDTSTAGRVIEDGSGYVAFNKPLPVIGSMVTFNSRFVEKYPELTQAIVDVYLEAYAKLRAVGSDADALLAMFPEEFRERLSPGLGAAWQLTAPLFQGNPGFTPDFIDNSVKFLYDHDLMTQEAEQRFRESFTNRFIDASSIKL